ncbi:DEAD/DEAH box helicase family protein [Streptomyces sp. NPDC055793]
MPGRVAPNAPPLPPQGARGTLVSATGSGKTITAAWATRDCFPNGRILATVPTLDLLLCGSRTPNRGGTSSPKSNRRRCGNWGWAGHDLARA